MTPKEKASQLINDFYDITYYSANDYGERFRIAKQCALIAVDEIIKSREDDGHFDDTLSSTSSEYYTPHPMYLTFWLEVKQEIEKL